MQDVFLTESEEEALLRMARASVETAVARSPRISLDGIEVTPGLLERHGAFVTLRKGGELRGCIGCTTNTRPLLSSVCTSAMRSAREDPRFVPVVPDELSALRIEVSALGKGDEPESPFARVRDVSDVLIGRDGLMVRHRIGLSGLLLPQVAIERGWAVEEFLAAVCVKAGLPGDGWLDEDAELYRFTAQVFGEGD